VAPDDGRAPSSARAAEPIRGRIPISASPGCSGSVLRYDGKRGTTWSIKYLDADGRQVKERVGKASEGWTRRKAEAVLRARLTDVEREGYRKPEPLTLAAFSERFEAEHLPGRNLKTSTRIDYELTIRRHLVPVLGSVELVELERRPELIERSVTRKLGEGLSPKTVHNHLALLGRMFKVAVRWRLVRSNPVEMIDPPRAADDAEPEVLTEVEIARVLAAYRVRPTPRTGSGPGGRSPAGCSPSPSAPASGAASCSASAGRPVNARPAAERPAGVGARRDDHAKSKTSRRALDLKEGGHVLTAFEEQYGESRYRTDDSLVF
jgi:hypothetical protein